MTTKAELISENAALRGRVAELEAELAQRKSKKKRGPKPSPVIAFRDELLIARRDWIERTAEVPIRNPNKATVDSLIASWKADGSLARMATHNKMGVEQCERFVRKKLMAQLKEAAKAPKAGGN